MKEENDNKKSSEEQEVQLQVPHSRSTSLRSNSRAGDCEYVDTKVMLIRAPTGDGNMLLALCPEQCL